MADVPLWIVLVALAAGWASGYLQAVWSARADAAESALGVVNAASDDSYSRGVAAALVSCEARIQEARQELAEGIAKRFACVPAE